MRYLYLLISFFLLTGFTKPDDRYINVNANAEVAVPADQIVMSIDMNATGTAPQDVYRQHKELEQQLVKLLESFSFKKEDIRFQPLSINKWTPRRDSVAFRTSQRVALTIDDFEKYEQIQLRLIEAGFDSFNGSFVSTHKEQGEDQALEQALENARDKAMKIARQTGVDVGSVISVDYSMNYDNGPVPFRREEAVQLAGKGLYQYDQTVTVRAHVSVRYKIKA